MPRQSHLDLFSGIGGFALAARWAGLQTIQFVELDPYCQKVLRKHWPDVPIHDDVKTLDGNQFKDIFLITGGFPCQDISIAGKGAGIDGERSGLWTELHRIIGEVRPHYALIENVPALTFRGGARVIGDLAEIGYDCEWQIVGADDVGAPHRRKRIWIVAYSNSTTSRGGTVAGEVGNERGEDSRTEPESIQSGNRAARSDNLKSCSKDVADSNSTRWEKREGKTTSPVFRTQQHRGEDVAYSKSTGCQTWSSNRMGTEHGSRRNERLPPGASECRGRWLPEPSVGRVAHGIQSRVDRLRGLGNAIVPQVAFEIIKAILNADCPPSVRKCPH